jgi:hypothetical protein
MVDMAGCAPHKPTKGAEKMRELDVGENPIHTARIVWTLYALFLKVK